MENCEYSKSLQHWVFPSGLPSKYWLNPMVLDLADRTGCCIFTMVWPQTIATEAKWYKTLKLKINVFPTRCENSSRQTPQGYSNFDCDQKRHILLSCADSSSSPVEQGYSNFDLRKKRFFSQVWKFEGPGWARLLEFRREKGKFFLLSVKIRNSRGRV